MSHCAPPCVLSLNPQVIKSEQGFKNSGRTRQGGPFNLLWTGRPTTSDKEPAPAMNNDLETRAGWLAVIGSIVVLAAIAVATGFGAVGHALPAAVLGLLLLVVAVVGLPQVIVRRSASKH